MDRTTPVQKLKKAMKGGLGLSFAFLAVAGIALGVGMKFGGGQAAPDAHGAHAGHGHAGNGHAGNKKDAHAAHGDAHSGSHAASGHDAHAKDPHAASNHDAHGADAHASAGHDTHSAPASHDSHAEHADAHEASTHDPHASLPKRLLGTYSAAWMSVQHKVAAIQTAETDNERLKLENTHLRTQLEAMQFSCSAKEASNKTRTIEYKLDRETGSMVGRDLASITYRVPTNLVPNQLYTLGISYFKAREDEKAAVIFTFLSGLDDNDSFKTPRNFLLTGIAWYRLDNFATADRYFDRALKAPATQENLQALAHARMWKALAAQRLSKHTQSQFWLTELIDHHPLSVEASWVNSKHGPRPTKGSRGTASDE